MYVDSFYFQIAHKMGPGLFLLGVLAENLLLSLIFI